MNIKIFKYDPSTDAEPYYIEHEVPWKEHMTALEAITYVHEEFEAVNFDYSCHGRACGRCAITVDDVPALACSTPITNGDHTIDPLGGHPIIHDLIVDKRAFGDRLSRQYSRVRTEPITSLEQVNGEYGSSDKNDKLYDLSNCLRCGLCQAGCPAVAANPTEYVGPAFMTALALRYYDPYDQDDRVLEAVSDGMYHCIMCGKCDELCPYFIGHLDIYKELRTEAEKRGLKPSYAA